MKTNKDKLPIQSLQGNIHHPTIGKLWTGYDGQTRVLPSVGGIVYNFQIGDNCMDVVGDHIEPGVSLQNPNDKENNALMIMSCIGNIAEVISGEAKGAKGYVTGKHGGIEHVFIYFPKQDLEKMHIGDTIAIKGHGQGLELSDYPDIKLLSLDPELLNRLHIIERSGILEIGVTHIIPAELMGAGLGEDQIAGGDYDIMTQDKSMIERYELNQLRFGDIVAIKNHECSFGPHYLTGACTIGVIVHSDSYTSGHGPGVTVIMTAKNDRIKPYIDKSANLKMLLDI